MMAISCNPSTKCLMAILGISTPTRCFPAFFPSKRFRYISSDTSHTKGHGPSGRSPIGCESFHTNLNILSSLPTTFVFC